MADIKRVGYMVMLGREMYYLSKLDFETLDNYPLLS